MLVVNFSDLKLLRWLFFPGDSLKNFLVFYAFILFICLFYTSKLSERKPCNSGSFRDDTHIMRS